MGQLLFGLARQPDAHQLHSILWEFLKLIDILPVDEALMEAYALSLNLTLVTAEQIDAIIMAVVEDR